MQNECKQFYGFCNGISESRCIMDYWNLYKDVWNFHKKYSKVQTDDAYWEAVVSESGAISKKYDNHKFAIALLLAVIDELERIYKEMMKNADTAV